MPEGERADFAMGRFELGQRRYPEPATATIDREARTLRLMNEAETVLP